MKELNRYIFEKLHIDKDSNPRGNNKLYNDYDSWFDYIEYNDGKVIKINNSSYCICLKESTWYMDDKKFPKTYTFPFFFVSIYNIKENAKNPDEVEVNIIWIPTDGFRDGKISFVKTSDNPFPDDDKDFELFEYDEFDHTTHKPFTNPNGCTLTKHNADLILDILNKLYMEEYKKRKN